MHTLICNLHYGSFISFIEMFYQNLAYEVNGTSTTINYFLLQNFTEIRKPDQSSLKCRTTEF